jgi:hypothetical protein
MAGTSDVTIGTFMDNWLLFTGFGGFLIYFQFSDYSIQSYLHPSFSDSRVLRCSFTCISRRRSSDGWIREMQHAVCAYQITFADRSRAALPGFDVNG